MKKMTFTFEVDTNEDINIVHDMICRLIHEGDVDAAVWLQDNVIDIDYEEGE